MRENKDKICWNVLSLNTNAILLLKNNPDRINWKEISINPSIFELDYEKMKENFQALEEEIIMEVMHPRRIIKKIEIYGDDYLEELFD